jgi:hypothetical protein
MIDTVAPRLKSLRFSNTIDVRNGSTTANFTAEADDADGSGIKELLVWLDKSYATPTGASRLLMFGFLGDTFLDDTPTIANLPVTFTQATAPGVYHVSEIELIDVAGNKRSYTAAELQTMGIATSFSVTGGVADTTPAKLLDLGLPSIIDVSKGTNEVQFTARAEDPGGAGVKEVLVWLDQSFATPTGSSSLLLFGFLGDTFRDDTPTLATESLALTTSTKPGTYHVKSVDVTDLAGNSISYTQAELKALGISTSFTVTGGVADTTPPKLLGLGLPQVVNVSQGTNEVKFTAQAEDPGGAGVKEVLVWLDQSFTTPTGSSGLLLFGFLGDTFRDDTPTLATESHVLTASTKPGTYNIRSVDVTDLAGNSISYTQADLKSLGIATSFSVTNTPAVQVPDAAVSLVSAGQDLRLDITSSAWKQTEANSFSIVLNYGASVAHYGSVSIGGGAGAFSTRVTEVGNLGTVTMSGTGSAQHAAAALEVTMNKGSPGLFTYTIESFTLNGKSMSLGGARTGSAYLGSEQADVVGNAAGITLVDTGGGHDVVQYANPMASYRITKTATGFALVDGNGLTTSLNNVERLVFSDKALALDTNAAAGQVYRLYQAAFDRKPDEGGIGYWLGQVDKGTSLGVIAQNFLSSDEFRKTYGAEISTEAFLTALYRNVLHRDPDKGGLDFWTKAVESGMDRVQALLEFSESTENVAQVIGSIENGFAYTAWA